MYSILTAFLLFSHEVNKRTDAAISELKKYVEFLKKVYTFKVTSDNLSFTPSDRVVKSDIVTRNTAPI